MKKIVPVVLLLAVVGGILWSQKRAEEATNGAIVASGTVEATEARLAFEAGGRIAEITVHEGDQVPAGTVLARLDASEAEARVRQAEAQQQAAGARLAELQRGFRREEVAQAQAAVEAASARLGNAESEKSRAATLFAGGAISREAYDRAVLAADLAAQELARGREQLALLTRGNRPETIETQRAMVAQAQAAVESAAAVLANFQLAAPFAGRITHRLREPGETVTPGSPVVTLLDPDDRWVRIYVPETRLGAVALGAVAEIRSDTYPDKVYQGEVTFLASEAEFTPKSVQTQEERVRLVYAAKVRVRGDAAFELKPGMPVDVRIPLAPASGS